MGWSVQDATPSSATHSMESRMVLARGHDRAGTHLDSSHLHNPRNTAWAVGDSLERHFTLLSHHSANEHVPVLALGVVGVGTKATAQLVGQGSFLPGRRWHESATTIVRELKGGGSTKQQTKGWRRCAEQTDPHRCAFRHLHQRGKLVTKA